MKNAPPPLKPKFNLGDKVLTAHGVAKVEDIAFLTDPDRFRYWVAVSVGSTRSWFEEFEICASP
jgi:hypothetical protein